MTDRLRTALVLGVNGQDGTFLARHLVKKGFRVTGVGRQPQPREHFLSSQFSYEQLDLRQVAALGSVLDANKPDLIFHVAAVHTSAGGHYEEIWHDALQVNVASVHAILEHLRERNPTGRLIYASSGKVFGEPYPLTVDEATPIKSNCLYSITKNTAFHLTNYYRRHYSLNASVVYLFNHESEFRPADYFIPKILAGLVSAKDNPKHVTEVNTLEFYCDWGSADEYMGLLVEMAELAPGEDFVLGTGTATYARKLVDQLFQRYGLEYQRHFVESGAAGASINKPYKVDTRKLQERIGRAPRQNIYDVCRIILEVKHELV